MKKKRSFFIGDKSRIGHAMAVGSRRVLVLLLVLVATNTGANNTLCCRAISAECVACQRNATVDVVCTDDPFLPGCTTAESPLLPAGDSPTPHSPSISTTASSRPPPSPLPPPLPPSYSPSPPLSRAAASSSDSDRSLTNDLSATVTASVALGIFAVLVVGAGGCIVACVALRHRPLHVVRLGGGPSR